MGIVADDSVNVEEVDVNVEDTGDVENSGVEVRKEPESVGADADSVEHWKAMSQKNERRAAENYKALQERDVQLAEAKMRIARFEVEKKYPAKAAAIIKLFQGDTPEGLSAWADEFMQEMGDVVNEEPSPQDKTDDTHVSALTAATIRMENQEGHSANAKPSAGDAYEQTRARLRAKRQKIQGKNK